MVRVNYDCFIVSIWLVDKIVYLFIVCECRGILYVNLFWKDVGMN